MVNLKSRIEALEAWRNGLELQEALKLFPPQLDRSGLVREAKAQRRISTSGKQKFRDAGMNADQLLDELARLRLHFSAAVQVGETKRARLIGALQRGELLALGYAADRPKTARPEAVPQFLIQLKFDNFAKSEFSDGERRYVHARIIPGRTLAKPKIGRPSPRDRVLGIASALAQAGHIQPTMPPKVQAGKIREYAEGHFPAEFTKDTPSDQTIKRHLKVFWNAN
jgi:hypothetical protein